MKKRKNYRTIDLNGQRFGKLNVLRKDETKRSTWICKCDCGNIITVPVSKLFDRTISCGCALKDAREKFVKRNTSHGDSHTKLYYTYRSMIDRCYCEKVVSYKRYGGRGIKVCDEWKNSYVAFKEWAYQNGYNENSDRTHQSLDRIDNNGDYCPQNCRWATAQEQVDNRNVTKFYEYNGEMVTASKFADTYKMPKHFVYGRLKRGRDLQQIMYEWNCKINPPSDLIKCSDYAKQIGLTSNSVIRKINKGDLKGLKIGRNWYVKA